MHQKKSEVQIGKESRGASSDYRRPPLLSLSTAAPAAANGSGVWADEALTTPHKRVHQQLQQVKIDVTNQPPPPPPQVPFPCLKEAAAAALLRHHKQHPAPPPPPYIKWLWQEKGKKEIMLGGRRVRVRLRFRILLPPLVIVSIPCLWLYFRAAQLPEQTQMQGYDEDEEAMLLSDLQSSEAAIVWSFWFDFFAAVVFMTAVVISLRIAYRNLKLSHRWPSFPRGKLGVHKTWGWLASKPLVAFLIQDREKKRALLAKTLVTWTIGSERTSKIISREAVRVYTNGDMYEGEFHQGKCSGSGVYYYNMSGSYEGDWIDGKYDGYGVETWARGSRYRGQYRQGFRHGYGVYRFYTGDVYLGEWCNGQSHGYGVHICEDGSRYVGEFKWGVKHGLGYYHFRNGDTYAGEYFADKMHGFGVYHFANGHQYEGAWYEGRKQGLGMYTFRNGERQSGHWHHGVLETPSTQNSQPGCPMAVNHSKVLNAVQEARCAAQKAFEIPRVDERVNKAITAANRAANAARVAAVKAVQKKMHGDITIGDV
ncbi:hypothetical protein SUGI_0171970 [Cryptomeria japonica]|uniref:uncharacterized protein LOC131873646 n=1 Tax=Cryptomeria japonica TaxID=3369 RepID=UPI002408A661|nr:uncharacterized protein LOC131873646 [Cryptomeria japonica]GLJ11582.1 hypothetical protein SUGI_0171970 [Cryptomeria japonica]